MSELSENLLADSINKIESSYEYMLAYAAQGRESEQSGGAAGPSIRQFLEELEQGLEKIMLAFAEKMDNLKLKPAALKSLDEFNSLLGKDADGALCAVKVVLMVPSISSQLVDNLNASAHLRCLLTDIFLLDEALKVHQRHLS